jgi:hypothetical protein
MIIILANIVIKIKIIDVFIIYSKEYLYINILRIIKLLKLNENKWLKPTLILYPFLITINEILVGTIDPYTYNYVYQQLKRQTCENLILYNKVMTQ